MAIQLGHLGASSVKTEEEIELSTEEAISAVQIHGIVPYKTPLSCQWNGSFQTAEAIYKQKL